MVGWAAITQSKAKAASCIVYGASPTRHFGQDSSLHTHGSGRQGHQHSTQQPLLAAFTMVSTPHIQHQVRRSAGGLIMENAPRARNATSPTGAGSLAAVESTLPSPAPAPALQGLSELQRAHTPLRRLAFERELKGHPDKAWVSWLLNGIDNGHPEIVDAELLKEVELGRILGPFSQRPLEHLRTSDLGAVPKKNGKWRVILHLSAPEGRSINDFIAKEEFSIHYSTIDDAVALLSRFSKGARMAKVDLKSAFRMVPIQASEWDLLGMYWRGQYYIDTCLPFGLRSAPNIFDNFASARHWVLENNYGAILLHYLDDFLLVGPPNQPTCQESMSTMLQVCEAMGIPVATEKCEGPATCITFLGIVLDSSLQQLRLPPEKLQDISSLIKSWLGKRKATKRELLSLIGADLRWWNSFLPSWNGISMFIAPEWKDADSFQLYTDASGSFGFGAYLDGAWFRGDWQPHQQLLKRSIQWQELFAIVAAALTWGHFLTGQRISQKQLYSFPGAPPRQTELHCGRTFPQSNVTLLFPCPPGQPAAHARTSGAGRALEGRLRHLLHRAVAPSTSTTYRAGIRKYYAFCTQFNLTPLPGSKHTINLFAAYLSQVLQANTTQVYLAAVTHLHLTRGFSSPAHNNPTLNLAIRGMQRSQGPAHLRPKRLPLTIGMLEQLLRLVNSDPLSSHDKLMLKAALTFGFFGFLRVSEYTRTTRGRFDPRLHPTRSDVTWVKEGLHFLIKKSKTDQTGRGTMISMGYTHRASCPVMALRAYFQNCTAPPRAALFHFHTGRPLTSRAMRAILKDLLLRGGYNTPQYNTHSLQIGAATAAAQAGLPPSTIQRLGRWSSAAYTTYTRHPLTSPSDTATLASAP
ncbi:hypothetical protein EMCRGX_G012664 [Ephydatia muelleri]